MADRERKNPFTDSRVTTTPTNSLLFYGDQNYSLFNRLKQNKRLYSSQVVGNDKQTEQQILRRYQKEYYIADQTGTSLAEQVFTRKVEEQNLKNQDFWGKISNSFHRSTKPNPFVNSETASTISMNSSFSTKSSRLQDLQKQNLRTERQSNRIQINKLRKTINQSKKVQQVQTNQERFSLVNMYKVKKAKQSLKPVFDFTESKSSQKSPTKQIFQYPQTIFVQEKQYFYIPLG